MGSLPLMQELLDPSSVEVPWSGGHRQLPSPICRHLNWVRHKVRGYVLLSPHHISLETAPSVSLCKFAVSGLQQGNQKILLFCGTACVNSSLPCHCLTSPWAALCQFSASISAPTKQLLRRTLPRKSLHLQESPQALSADDGNPGTAPLWGC